MNIELRRKDPAMQPSPDSAAAKEARATAAAIANYLLSVRGQ
jgi:hypothetical protein